MNRGVLYFADRRRERWGLSSGMDKTLLLRSSRVFPQKLYHRRRVRRSGAHLIFRPSNSASAPVIFFASRDISDNIGWHMTTEMIHVRACVRTERALFSRLQKMLNIRDIPGCDVQTVCNNRSANYRWRINLEGRIMFRLWKEYQCRRTSTSSHLDMSWINIR